MRPVEARAAFLAGVAWLAGELRLVNDGDGHVDLVEPVPEEISAAAEQYAQRFGSAGRRPK